MVSKSTKRKNRLNARVLAALAGVRLLCIDPRHDFWLLSRPDARPGEPHFTFHREIYGKAKALRVLRSVHKAFPLDNPR